MKLNKLLIFCFISLILLANNSYAVDMGVLQEQCAEIGFKIKTSANGRCVLRLMKSVTSQHATQSALKAPVISSTNSVINTVCRIDSDCNYGLHCRSKSDGGTECSTVEYSHVQRSFIQQPIQPPPIQQPVQQQNEVGIGTTLLEILGAAAQGWNQGMRQSAPVPIYRPTTAHCNSAYSSLSKSVNTTCTQY